MSESKTLLRIPELIKAVNPLVANPITHKDIFQLIGDDKIRPFGFIQRIPVFSVEQVAEVAKYFQSRKSKPTVLGANV